MENNTTPQSPTNDNSTLVTVLLLIFAYPIGMIVMWFWPKWKVWVKLLVSLPFVIGIIAIVASVMMVALNPEAQNAFQTGAACGQQCQTATDQEACIQECLQENLDLEMVEDDMMYDDVSPLTK